MSESTAVGRSSPARVPASVGRRPSDSPRPAGTSAFTIADPRILRSSRPRDSSARRQSLLFQADLADATTCKPLVENAWSQTGGFDAWIHLAGADLLTGPEARWPFEQKLDLITRVDLVGTILTTREAGRRMFEAGRGSIVTIGWDQSATGMEGDSGEIFAAIKGGVAAFSRSLAKSLGPVVRVNCVAPGWIKTALGRERFRWLARSRSSRSDPRSLGNTRRHLPCG